MVRKPVHSGRVTRTETAAPEPTAAKRSGRFAAFGIDSLLVVAVLIVVILATPDSAPSWTSFVPMAFLWGYPIVTIGLLSRTVGQLVVGVRVVRVEDFRRPGIGRAALWTLGVFVPAMFVPAGLGYVAAVGAKGSFAFSDTQQGVHDRLARTMVVSEVEWKAWSRGGA